MKTIRSESKGKGSAKVSPALDELQFLMDFNASITQAAAKTMEHLSDFVFISMGNLTLFHVQGRTYQFKALPFGLSTAPLEFTVVAKEVKLMAINKGIRIHQYLDDWLVRARSHQESLQHTQDLVKICQKLGWLVNLEKSELEPKTCSANLYRHIKRRVGRSLKRAHCQRNLVTARKQAAYKLPRTKGSLSSLKRVLRRLCRQDSTCGNRQHYSSVIHKQGRRHEVGHTLCPTVENLDLVYQTSSNSQSPTHSGPAERGSRQTIPFRTDHSNGMVPPSRGFPNIMQQVAPTSNRLVCHEVQQQAPCVRVTGTGSSGRCRCTQPAMGGSGCICLPTSSHLWQSGGEVARGSSLLPRDDPTCLGVGT